MLKRAIDCFVAQLYQWKELIVVYESDDIAMVNFVATCTGPIYEYIHFVCVDAVPKRTLGELRNIGIEKATGKYICQWDDDDWYHANRLAYQCNELLRNGKNGSVMTQWMVFDATNKNAYVSSRRIWEGSILCEKSVLQLMPYASMQMGEDTDTIEYLTAKGYLHQIKEAPALYIYIYHGKNTWHFEHWDYIFQCSDRLPDEDAASIADILKGRYAVREGSVLLDKIVHQYYSAK